MRIHDPGGRRLRPVETSLATDAPSDSRVDQLTIEDVNLTLYDVKLLDITLRTLALTTSNSVEHAELSLRDMSEWLT